MGDYRVNPNSPPASFGMGGISDVNYPDVGILMKRVLMSMASMVDAKLQTRDLTNAQWVPLMRLKVAGALPVAELARWIRADPGSTTRLLDRLEKKGFCRRVRAAVDRRVVTVELTASGLAGLDGVPSLLAEVMNAHLAGFSDAECRELDNFLRRIAANCDRLSGIAPA
jgi:DNA-binding MarR family transcriptional regulator